MIDINKLDDEAYALKTLIALTYKYEHLDSNRINMIMLFSKLPGCLPGRVIGSIFNSYTMNEEDRKILQSIINIYA